MYTSFNKDYLETGKLSAENTDTIDRRNWYREYKPTAEIKATTAFSLRFAVNHNYSYILWLKTSRRLSLTYSRLVDF